MEGVEKWEMQFHCSFMNKSKIPGSLAADRGAAKKPEVIPYDYYTPKPATGKAASKTDG